MALRELDIVIGFQLDSSPLERADQQTDAFKANALSAEQNTRRLGSTIAQVGNTATSSMGAASTATTSLGSSVNAATGPFGRLRTAGVNAVNAINKAYTQHKAQIEDIGTTLEKNRGVLTGVFAATAGMIGFSVKTAAEFEEQMSRVGALSGANEKELALLARTARQLGADTAFSASEAAEGMQFLAVAGFQVNEIIAAMPGLLDTAAAAKSDLGTTADIVSNILAGFGLSADETTRIADVLTAAFTSSNTTLESLGDTMSYVAPVAASVGADIETVAAMAGRLGDFGIQGQRAGTALRAIFTRLAAPTGEAAKLLTELGISTQDASGNFLPMIDIMRQIEERTASMGSAQRANILSTLVGLEAVSAFSALLEVGSDNIASYTEELRNSAGLAQAVATRQLDNLKGSLEELGGAFEEAQISIGNAFIPVIRLGADTLRFVINLFNMLPQPIKTVIAFGIGFVGMLTGVALAASFVIPQLTAMGKLLTLTRAGFLAVGKVLPFITAGAAKLGITLNLSFWPVTLVIGAIVAGIFLLQDALTYLRGGGDTLTGRVVAWVKEWLSFGTTIGGVATRIGTWIIQGFQAGLAWITGLPGRTLGALSNWINHIRAWFSSSFNIGDVLQSALQRAMDYIPAPLRGIAEKIMSFLPQSPAEEGPLSRLDRVGTGFVNTLADSLGTADTTPLNAAMQRIAGTVDLSSDEAATNASAAPATAPRGAGLFGGNVVNLDLTVHVDARGATADDAQQIGDVTADRIRRVIEEFVTLDYHAAVLEGI